LVVEIDVGDVERDVLTGFDCTRSYSSSSVIKGKETALTITECPESDVATARDLTCCRSKMLPMACATNGASIMAPTTTVS